MADGDLFISAEFALDVPSANENAQALQAALAGVPVTVLSPLSRAADLRLFVGDDYTAGRAIVMPAAAGDVWPPDLTGWALAFFAVPGMGGQALQLGTVTADDAVAPGQQIRVELPSVDAARLPAGSGLWRVIASQADEKVTLRHGRLLTYPSP